MASIEAQLIDHMGSDLRVANAARVSFAKESSEFTFRKDVEKGSDEGLIEYLARNDHFTPFTHVIITMRETVPIFVARQRFKHTVGFSYNEISRRYVDDTPEFYVPEVWRSRPEGSVKQGSGSETVNLRGHLAFESGDWDNAFNDYSLYELEVEHRERSLILYNSLLRANVAPEQARMVLPQSMMTEYYVTGSIAAWARAYKLRSDSHAQKEIQDLAKIWNDVISGIEDLKISWKVLTNA